MSIDDTSDDAQRPAEKWDPLTVPNWDSINNVPSVAPPVEEFFTEPTIVQSNPPQPADVNQILRGEYTGWVPIIKPGDSLADATKRFEVDNQNRAEAAAQEEKTFAISSPNLNAEDISEIQDLIREIKAEPEVYVKDFYPNFRDIAADPETVVSPSQALDEARRRIEQMRANLQVNLSRVAQSFDHPIFEPEKMLVEEIAAEVPDPVLTTIIEPEVAAPAPVLDENVHIPMPTVEAEIISEPVVEQERSTYQEPVSQPVTSVATEEKPKEDHSLELVIMRDEIKDLRDRLDSSQKLIETLMERLANLAELALKRN